MKKLYNAPELEVLWFDEVEIVTDSGDSSNSSGSNGTNETSTFNYSFDSSDTVSDDLNVYSVENIEIK